MYSRMVPLLRQRLLLRVADLIDAHHIDPDDHLISGSCVGPRRQQQKKRKAHTPGKTSWNRTSHRAQGQFAAFGQGVAQEGAYMRDAAWAVSGPLPSSSRR